MIQSPVNKWVKSLTKPQKDIFFQKLTENDLLWYKLAFKEERRKRFDNFRYLDVSQPHPWLCVLIYVSAKYADPDLKIETLYPHMPTNYKVLSKYILELSLKTNNWKDTADDIYTVFKRHKQLA